MIMVALLAITQADYIESLPPADRPYTFLIDVRYVPDEHREQHVKALQFTLASASRQRVIEYCTAQPTGIPGLMAVDIRNLLWDGNEVTQVFQRYPYGRKVLSKRHNVIAVPRAWRADWLILELWDTTRSDARYRLLYGDADINRDQWLEFHGQQKADKEFAIGFIEGNSGVTVSRKRVLISDERRDNVWTTLDFLEVDGKGDPLEQPGNVIDWQAKPIHDGSEHIAALYKHSIKTGERGVLQDYFLSNAKGERVEAGPAALVQDRTRAFRGLSEIRLGACVTCHGGGLNFPTSDEWRLFRGSRYVTQAAKVKLGAFFAPVARKMETHNVDFEAGVKLVNGLSGEQNAKQFAAVVAWYDADVTPEQAARELGIPAEELGLAIAYSAKQGIDVGARLSHLAEGGDIPRSSWESNFTLILEVIEQWQSSKR